MSDYLLLVYIKVSDVRGSSDCWEGGELEGGEVHRVQGRRAPGEGRGRSERE